MNSHTEIVITDRRRDLTQFFSGENLVKSNRRYPESFRLQCFLSDFSPFYERTIRKTHPTLGPIEFILFILD